VARNRDPEISNSLRSKDEALAQSQIKPTRRVPQVRRLNLGLAVDFEWRSSLVSPDPQKPFTHPNNRSTLIFVRSL
jgi:hypothetical protein